MADTIQAMKNQIEYHDIPNLNRRQLSEFLKTDEGRGIQENAIEMSMMKQQISSVVATREDLRVMAATRPPGSASIIHAESQIEDNIKNVMRRAQGIRDRIPQQFFTQSLPLDQQMPTLRGDERVNTKSLSEDKFIKASEIRLSRYQDYRTDRIKQGRNPLSFEDFQHFNYDNILVPKNERIRRYDPALLARLEDYDLGGNGKSVSNRFDDLDEPEATSQLSRMGARDSAYGYASAFEALPTFMRPRASETSYTENLKRFTDEVQGGSAELTGLQEDILRHSNIPYNRGMRGGALSIPHEEGTASGRFIKESEFRYLKHAGSVAITSFKTQEAKERAIEILNSSKGDFERLYNDAPKGRPTKDLTDARRVLINRVNEDISTLDTRPVVANVNQSSDTVRIPSRLTVDPTIDARTRKNPSVEQDSMRKASAKVKDVRRAGQPTVSGLARDNAERYHRALGEVRGLSEESVKRTAMKTRLGKE
jgi:hypothetical protein